MRIAPDEVAGLDMLIDGYLPGCEFVNVHRVEVSAPAEAVWVALPEAPRVLAPKGVIALPLWLSALARFELSGDDAQPFKGRFDMHEGEAISIATDPSHHAVIIDKIAEGREFVAKGHHRYADYVTNAYVEPLRDGRSRLYNVTRANFARSPLGRSYYAAVRLLHDPIVEWGLGRLKRYIEAGVCAGPPAVRD